MRSGKKVVLGLASCVWCAAQNPLATVDGAAIRESDLNVRGQLLQLEQQAYQIRLRGLEEAIAKRVLEKAAATRKLTVEELLQQEVESKVPDPSPAEVEAFYLGQRDRLQQPLEAVREQVRKTLKSLRLGEARQNYLQTLRARSAVNIYLKPLRVNVEIGDSPRRGPPTAPVTIVAFSDFQCPYCRKSQPVLRELASDYGDRVSLVHKDLPLPMHPEAERAAQAARCAGDQGKFWDYHDGLYAESALQWESYPKIAKKLGLDEGAFQSCLDSGKHRPAVEADKEQAQTLGITGTPMFLINGLLLNGAQPVEAFRRLVDAELEVARAR
jgi:protein-disulfide isomerase